MGTDLLSCTGWELSWAAAPGGPAHSNLPTTNPPSNPRRVSLALHGDSAQTNFPASNYRHEDVAQYRWGGRGVGAGGARGRASHRPGLCLVRSSSGVCLAFSWAALTAWQRRSENQAGRQHGLRPVVYSS